MDDPLMDINDLAEYLRISVRRTQELVTEHDLKSVGWGKTRRWRLSVIDAWLEPKKPAQPDGQPGTTQRKNKKIMLPSVAELVRL